MSANQIQSSYAEVNGVKLHYLHKGQGPLLLFLHGFPEFSYAWRKQLAEFGLNFTAVAPDMRGYNLSSKPQEVEAYAIKNLIEDVRQLSAHVGHQKFTLIGHDWGGAVAWAFAAKHPECLEKLIIINAPHPGIYERLLREDPGQQKASQYMLMFRSSKAEETLTQNNFELLVRIMFSLRQKKGWTEEDEKDKQEYLKAWSQPGAITGGLNYYRSSRIGPPSEGVESTGNFAADPKNLTIQVPTLVIWGEEDIALPLSNLQGLEEYVPQLKIQRIPQASHWVIHEKTAEVNRFINEFI